MPRATLDNRTGTLILALTWPWYNPLNTHELLPRPLA